MFRNSVWLQALVNFQLGHIGNAAILHDCKLKLIPRPLRWGWVSYTHKANLLGKKNSLMRLIGSSAVYLAGD